jgi:hypothetical protein
VKIIFGITGGVIGAIFGLIVAIAIVGLLSQGNTVAEGFSILFAGPTGLLAGLVAGAVGGARVFSSLWGAPTSGNGRRERLRKLVGLALGITAAFVAVIWLARETVEPPSDAAMLRRFTRQEGTFNSLVEMASVDKGLIRVDENWTMPDDTQRVGVSTERLAAYRRLLRDAGTPRGYKASADGTNFDFYFWMRGSAISDDVQKGFAYRAIPPPSILPTLDGVRHNRAEYFVAYRHIHGNWYLFYEFIPD